MVDAIQFKNGQMVDEIVERSLEEWKKQIERANIKMDF
jgi:hypothetical protein